MVILKTLLDRGEIASGHGRLLLSMSIVQDLIVVVLIVVLPMLISLQSGLAPLDVGVDVAIALAKAAAFIGVSLAIGLRVVPWMMGHVSRMRSSELFIVTAAVLALGAASVSTLLGLSAALGAFVAGLVLSESEFDHRVIAEVVPVRDLFATLFFVSVGMLIDIHFIVEHWGMVLATAAFTLGAQGAVDIPRRVAVQGGGAHGRLHDIGHDLDRRAQLRAGAGGSAAASAVARHLQPDPHFLAGHDRADACGVRDRTAS